MKILMLNYEYPPLGGGGGIVTQYLAKNLAAMGHEVEVITSKFKGFPSLEAASGFRVHRVPVLRKNPHFCRFHEMLTYVISGSFYSLRFVREFKPDLIHAFFGIPSAPIAYLLKKVYGYPYVVFLGGRDVPRPNPDPPYYALLYKLLKPAIKRIWANAQTVVACSQGLRQLALKTDPKAKIEVIPDGIELQKFPYIQYIQHLENLAASNPIKILTIARLIPRKGVQFLIQSLPEIKKSVQQEFVLEVVGDGPYKSELIELAKKLKVEGLISFAGSMPYDDLPKKYQDADIFALPSLAEGMPLVVLEAMASGLPIVASRVQGLEELVADEINGYLVSPADISELSRSLISLINEASKRHKMGLESRRIAEGYDWKNIAESYLKVYEKCLIKGGGRRAK